jgi:hypothetical protein
MRTMIQSDQDVPQFEAVALRDWGRDAAPSVVNDEPEGAGDDKSFPLEEARRLAQAILRLDGLTGAEIEAAERVLSVDRADIRRLREIAGNHAMLIPEFFSLNASGARAQEGRTSGIQR